MMTECRSRRGVGGERWSLVTLTMTPLAPAACAPANITANCGSDFKQQSQQQMIFANISPTP